jgi:hypothetical protein
VEFGGADPWNLEKGAQATAEWWYLKAALQDHQGAIERLEEIDELMVYGVVAEQKREIAEIKSRWEARCADLEALMEQDFAELETRLGDGKAISLFDVVSDKDQAFISCVDPKMMELVPFQARRISKGGQRPAIADSFWYCRSRRGTTEQWLLVTSRLMRAGISSLFQFPCPPSHT